MMSTPTYAAIVQRKPGQYGGELRNIHGGQVWECDHKHKRRTLAWDCARRELARRVASVTA